MFLYSGETTVAAMAPALNPATRSGSCPAATIMICSLSASKPSRRKPTKSAKREAERPNPEAANAFALHVRHILDPRPADDQKPQLRCAAEDRFHWHAARRGDGARDRIVVGDIEAAAHHHLRALRAAGDVNLLDIESLLLEKTFFVGNPQRRQAGVAKGHAEINGDVL